MVNNIRDLRLQSEPDLSLDDILIEPQNTSITSRYGKNLDPRVSVFSRTTFPLFVAPMDTVVGPNSYQEFLNQGLNVCLMRNNHTDLEDVRRMSYLGVFSALSLDQFKDFTKGEGKFEGGTGFSEKYLICVDVANGHMKRLHELIALAKSNYGDQLVVMSGNVASADGYIALSEAGCDFVRVGIGGGAGCLTSVQTGVGRGMASLIRECSIISDGLDNPAFIVADGGMKTYSDIIKSIALGADFVMAGSIFNKALESEAKSMYINDSGEETLLDPIEAKEMFFAGEEVWKSFRGMSTKAAQKNISGGKKIRTSEGVVRRHKVEYTLKGWVENFESYLRSAMSYSDSLTIAEFQEKCIFRKISNNVKMSFLK